METNIANISAHERVLAIKNFVFGRFKLTDRNISGEKDVYEKVIVFYSKIHLVIQAPKDEIDHRTLSFTLILISP